MEHELPDRQGRVSGACSNDTGESTSMEVSMTQLTRAELETIGRFSAENCFTFIIPTESNQPKAYDKGRIRLKNTLTQAENVLSDNGWSPPDIQRFFDPVSVLLNDSVFWSEQAQTLVIYHAADFTEQFRLPYELAGPHVNCSTRFNIRPLLPYFFKDNRFYLLQLSQNQVQLYEANRHYIERLQVEALPGSMDQALRFDDPESRLFAHQKGDIIVFHGHHPKDEENAMLRRFFNLVDKALCRFLGDSEAPLLLAAVEHYLPIYQSVTDYPHLVDAVVTGNFDDVSAEKLHAAAWPIMRAKFDEARTSARQRLEIGVSADLATDDLQIIVTAAHYGQIDTLFMPQDQRVYGTFDPATGSIEHDDDGVELLDLAATQVLLQSGEIYGADELAALLRSPAHWAVDEAALSEMPTG